MKVSELLKNIQKEGFQIDSVKVLPINRSEKGFQECSLEEGLKLYEKNNPVAFDFKNAVKGVRVEAKRGEAGVYFGEFPSGKFPSKLNADYCLTTFGKKSIWGGNAYYPSACFQAYFSEEKDSPIHVVEGKEDLTPLQALKQI